MIHLVWSVASVLLFFPPKKPSQVILKHSHGGEALIVISPKQLQDFSKNQPWVTGLTLVLMPI